ncbi:MAG: sigma-70 family RNA polymerase sigma factor [Prevotella sp.]|nr:sigma-70 family RNA polymerase sigma factor [Prevotella sp.]
MTPSEFETIAMELRAKALGITRRMMSEAEDAEDIAGDVMLRLWTLHAQLHDRDHALKLAAVIAHRLSIDQLRRQKKSLHLFDSSDKGAQAPAGAWANPSQELELKEDEAWLVQQMEKLPPRELQVLRMRQMEHRTNEEIARLLGIGEASVKVMLSNARRKLFNDIKKRH